VTASMLIDLVEPLRPTWRDLNGLAELGRYPARSGEDASGRARGVLVLMACVVERFTTRDTDANSNEWTNTSR
jgi:hypothetical protein